MQEPLRTDDSLLMNIPVDNSRSLPHPRQYAAATATTFIPPQWNNGAFVGEAIRMDFRNELLRYGSRGSDDQLELLGQFELSGSEPPQRLVWPRESHLCTSAGQEIPRSTPEEQGNYTEYEPWNHRQNLVVSEPHVAHLFRLDSAFSDASGIVSNGETLAWPINEPPASSIPFVYDGSVGYGDVAEPRDGPNMFNIQQPPETYGFPCSQDDNFGVSADRLEEDTLPNLCPHEGSFQSINDDSYHFLDQIVDNSTTYIQEGLGSYHNCELWNYLQKLPSYPTGEVLLSPSEEDTMPMYCDESTSCHYDDPLTELAEMMHPQSEAIKIEGACDRFQSDMAASFPPMAGFFPKDWPDDEPRNSDGPSSRAFALRPASRNSRVNRKLIISATMPTLSVIHEDGRGGLALSTQNTMKGRRVGPLSKSKAAQAAKNRKEKCVCIRCKMMKQSCSGEVPCRGCKENIGAKIWKSPCIKAEFLDIIEAGTCNYISQRSINHLTLDHSRRVTMLLPETFNLTELLDLLKPRLSCFNIHARQLSGSLYTLDLAKCYDFLSEIHKGQESGATFQLRDFIDNKLLKGTAWLTCVTEPCLKEESLGLLAKWNNMPSRASYDIVPLTEGGISRPMNVEDSEDRIEILIAAQLSRIICRALEVAAFKYLHKELNRYTKGSKSHDQAEKFVRDLGQLLLTLRWRISWWELLGDGSAIRDDSRDRYVERVKTLTRVLYFYYCNAKKKLPSFLDPRSLKGVQSCYADAEPIFDEFPHEDSIEGFQNWMEHGQELIHEAGVPRRLSRY